jgi:hypothetical protein
MAEGDAGNGFETTSVQQTDIAATRKRDQPRFRQSVDLTADRFEREAEKLTNPVTTEHEIEGVVAEVGNFSAIETRKAATRSRARGRLITSIHRRVSARVWNALCRSNRRPPG